MKFLLIRESLDDSQKEILEKFITHFFEPTGNRRNYRTNEIEYVYVVFYKIFKKHFGFTPNQVDILKSFQNCGFKIYMKSGGSKDKKLGITLGKLIEVSNFDLPEKAKMDNHFMEISPLIVKALSRMHMNLPLLKDTNIIKEIKDYEIKFENFLRLIK